MNAATSFQHLIDNLPGWREQITQLTTYTSQKHEEFKAEYVRLVSQAKPRRMKSPSVSSIRTDDNADLQGIDVAQSSTIQPPDPVDISPFEAGNRYIYAQATRKRKPGTSFRSGASGPMKFRSKQMVVIYYDSHTQEQLDALVKSIGSSRNNLRKGKTAYTVSKGLQLPSLGRRYDLPSPPSGLDGIRSTAALRKTPKAPSTEVDVSPTTDNIPTGEAAFKQADKDLETCQNLCETAAHQFLRDGDCKLELDTVILNLDKVLGLAKTTLEWFKLEEEKKKNETSVENASVTGSTHTESDVTLVEKSSREVLNLGHKLGPASATTIDIKRPSLPSPNSAPPATMEIEVDDDSDQSSIEIDLSKYRSIGRAGGRRPPVRT